MSEGMDVITKCGANFTESCKAKSWNAWEREVNRELKASGNTVVTHKTRPMDSQSTIPQWDKVLCFIQITKQKEGIIVFSKMISPFLTLL